jgi:DNA-binding MarR family transcriptional regulator
MPIDVSTYESQVSASRMSHMPDNTEQNPGHLPAALLGSTGYLLFKVGMAAKRAINGDVSADGCSMRHYAILACLEEFGSMTQREIAERMLFDASDMVELVDVLEANGFVERQRNEHDRRRYDVTITTKGVTELRKEAKRNRSATRDFLEVLTVSEQAQLHDLLRRVFAAHDPRVPN